MAQKSLTKGNGDGKPPERIKFHYIKSTHFRTVHADGAIGNLTPTNLIHMAIYNERPPIPREMVHKLNPDGTLGEVIHSETQLRDGLVREMEVDILMSVENAKSMKVWLEEKIQQAEKRKE